MASISTLDFILLTMRNYQVGLSRREMETELCFTEVFLTSMWTGSGGVIL